MKRYKRKFEEEDSLKDLTDTTKSNARYNSS